MAVMTVTPAVAFLLPLVVVQCNIATPAGPASAFINLACRIASANDEQLTIVYLEDTDDDLLKCLSSAYLPLFTVTSDSVTHTRNYSSLHILTIAGDTHKRLEQIGSVLGWIKRQKHRAKYVLIFQVPCEEFLDQIFRLFWANGLLNVIAMCSTNQQIYTYEPFTEVGFKVIALTRTTGLFYDKLTNLHHFEIRASQFFDPIRSLPTADNTDFTGPDGYLGKTIIEHLNATHRIILPPNGELYGNEFNGTLNGALKQVVTGFTHLNWNLRYIVFDQTHLYEYVYPIGKRFVLHLVVPKARVLPKYSNFIRVFDPLTWWMLLLNYCVVAITFDVIQRLAVRLLLADSKISISFRNMLVILFKTAIGDPVQGFHRISSLRQYLISWVLFCYVITSIYIAKMESVFIHPAFEQDIDTLGDLSRINVHIYVHNNFLTIIEDAVEPMVYETIYSKHRLLPPNYEAKIQSMTKVSHNRYAFILRRERATGLIARTFDIQAKRPRYHLVREYLAKLPQTYIVTNGSPFLKKFDRLVMRCFEHGLTKHWEVASKGPNTMEPTLNGVDTDYDDDEDEVDDDEDSKKRAIVLNMDELQGAFYFWTIGIGVACLGFALELGYLKWIARRRLPLVLSVSSGMSEGLESA